ncbi:RNA polymerase sigma factor [Streptomyces sp. NPDC088785]|uniref:RNA polymerase sigma factor n=1 Tax=Streptomyces sp. NPDC088785 TaxID=3365897 RepID=UPI00381BBE0D
MRDVPERNPVPERYSVPERNPVPEEGTTAAALGALYASHRGAFLVAARRSLAAHGVPESVASAEDLVQDAFDKALRNPSVIRHPSAYLHRLIRTDAAGRARRQANRRRLDAVRAADPLRRDPVRVADFSTLVVNRCALQQAMARLTPSQRTAVWTTKAMGRTQAETAALMDRSPGTVATHVSRGMALLRAGLTAVLVAGIAWAAAGRHLGGHRRRTGPARSPGTGVDLQALCDRWPLLAPTLAVSLLLAAAYGTTARPGRRFPADALAATALGRRIALWRTRRAWSRATGELGLPFHARTLTRDSIVFTAPRELDPDAVARGAEQLAAHLRTALGRTVRVTAAPAPSRGPHPAANTRLADVLARSGWARGELAVLINRRAAALGHPRLATDTSRVRRWLDQGEVPRAPVPGVLAALFTERLGRTVTIEDLGLARGGGSGHGGGTGGGHRLADRSGDGLPWAPERTAAVLTEFTGMDLMLNRAGAVREAFSTGTATALSKAALSRAVPKRAVEGESARRSVRDSLRVLEAVCRAPSGPVTASQLAGSLPDMDPVRTELLLAVLVREGHLHRLPGYRYMLGGRLPTVPTSPRGPRH